MILNFSIEELQKKLAAVETENKTIRDEFNVQRAKLKEIFLQKEGSHHYFRPLSCSSSFDYRLSIIFFLFQKAECKKLNEQLIQLREELNETKSQVVVAEYKRETDIQNQDRKAQEEIASLQHFVHGR